MAEDKENVTNILSTMLENQRNFILDNDKNSINISCIPSTLLGFIPFQDRLSQDWKSWTTISIVNMKS